MWKINKKKRRAAFYPENAPMTNDSARPGFEAEGLGLNHRPAVVGLQAVSRSAPSVLITLTQ